MINHRQAKALAAFVHTIRDDWGVEGILTAIGRVRDEAPIDVVTGWAVRAALEPSNRTPAIIAMAGPHREPPPRQSRTSFNIPCPLHPGETLPCGRCAHEAASVEGREQAAALARAQLQSARSQLCPVHGVRETHCRGAHEPQEEPA